MNKIKCLTRRIEFALCAALFGALSGSIQAQVETSVSVGLPGIEIRAESDFYEPLTPYGRWEVVGSYGRCWIPARVQADWRPYSEGHWQRTEAGWYWVSEEPWAWATYHYGRWDFTDQYGWYWVPQIQWAPAWVSWHSGGGYVGWAPLYPSARFAGGSLEIDVRVISPRAYVFVEEGHFLQPVSRSTVVVNNTTIINKTVNITNTRIVNNTVINEGPATAVIEKASGRKVQPVAVQELRRKQEAPVLARQQITAPAGEKKEKSIPAPVRSEVEQSVKKAAAAPAPDRVEKPFVTAPAPAPLTPVARARESEKAKPAPAQAEPRSETPRPEAIKEPTAPKAAKSAQPPEPLVNKPEMRDPARPPVPPAHEKPVASEKKEKPTGQGHNHKPEERPGPPEKPAVPPPSAP